MYFEIDDPYYALIEAGSREKALDIYECDVAYIFDEDDFDEDNMKQVPENYALQKYLRCTGENGMSDNAECFKKLKNEVVLIDWSLL